jgi:hypothetical protein
MSGLRLVFAFNALILNDLKLFIGKQRAYGAGCDAQAGFRFQGPVSSFPVARLRGARVQKSCFYCTELGDHGGPTKSPMVTGLLWFWGLTRGIWVEFEENSFSAVYVVASKGFL